MSVQFNSDINTYKQENQCSKCSRDPSFFDMQAVILMFPQSHLDFELSLFRIKWFQARCQKSQLPTGNP